MEQTLATSELSALSEKIDRLAAQVEYLTEHARQTARRQDERSELLNDVAPIANEALELVTEQLEDIQGYVDLCDLLRLAKRLLRNGRNLNRILDQLESLMDLAQTVGPLTEDVMEKATDMLEAGERRGYFAFARSGARMVDGVVGSFTEEDLRNLGNSVGSITDLVKALAQPRFAATARDIVRAGVAELAQPTDTSMRSLLRLARDPDVRRGLVVAMRLLRTVGAQSASKKPA